MTEELIADVLDGDRDVSERAAAALVEMGAEAGRAVIAAIEAEDCRTRSSLHDVLLAMEDPGLLPDVCELLDSPHAELCITAFELIGYLGDESALGPLLDALGDETQVSRQRFAARSLGVLGRQDAIAPLLELARKSIADWSDPDQAVEAVLAKVIETWDVSPLMLLPEVAVALARLGRQDLGSVMVRLASFDPSASELDEMDDIRIARNRAARALCHVTGSGMVDALGKAAREGDFETREGALEALFYLGLPESAETLLEYLDDRTHSVRHNAMIWFNRLTGQAHEPGDTPPDEPRVWWKQHARSFRAGVCHRNGVPLLLRALVEEFEQQPGAAEDLVRELYIVSGKDLKRDRRGDRRSLDWPTLARDWFDSPNVPAFEQGRLYKYGVACDVT